MSDKPADRTRPLGAPSGPSQGVEGLAEWVAAGIVLVWMGVVLFWGLGLTEIAGLGGVVFLFFAVLLPVAMLGLLVLLLRRVRDLRAHAAALSVEMAMLRRQRAKGEAERGARPEAAEATGPGASPGFASRRAEASQAAPLPMPPAAPPGEEQPALALAVAEGEGDPTEPVAVADLIRALQFPESAEDHLGFAALRRALADRGAAKLIRAAQDVLTLLAQDGIYMDNLAPDRARPDLWRRFALGERGRPIAAVGGVRDRSCLALTGQKMREDPVFRDAAHHFLRAFDRALAQIEPRMKDADLGALAETRTARAFMLVGRVAGTFD